MPKIPEQQRDDEQELRETDSVEISSDYTLGEKEEIKSENPEAIQREIENLKNEIDDIVSNQMEPEAEAVDPKKREEKIKEYQGRYLPDYLRKKGTSAISRGIIYLTTRGDKFEKEGKENIPERGPFIVVCNHFGSESGVDDSKSLLNAFKDFDLHLAQAKEMWWDRSVFLRWFFKKMGTIPVEESLANLTEEQKEEALEHQGTKYAKKVFRKIIDKEKQGKLATNIEFTRQAVALLSRGDAVSVYPEGLWLDPQGPKKLREKPELKKGYRGIELIAMKYQELTGEELPIIPTAFIEDGKTGKKKITIGKQLLLSENETNLNGTDWAMAHVAEMLPEEQRGYYKDIVPEK